MTWASIYMSQSANDLQVNAVTNSLARWKL